MDLAFDQTDKLRNCGGEIGLSNASTKLKFSSNELIVCIRNEGMQRLIIRRKILYAIFVCTCHRYFLASHVVLSARLIHYTRSLSQLKISFHCPSNPVLLIFNVTSESPIDVNMQGDSLQCLLLPQVPSPTCSEIAIKQRCFPRSLCQNTHY